MYIIKTICDKCDIYEVHFDHVLNEDVLMDTFGDWTYEGNIPVFKYCNGYIKYLRDILIFEHVGRSEVEKIAKKLDLIA